MHVAQLAVVPATDITAGPLLLDRGDVDLFTRGHSCNLRMLGRDFPASQCIVVRLSPVVHTAGSSLVLLSVTTADWYLWLVACKSQLESPRPEALDSRILPAIFTDIHQFHGPPLQAAVARPAWHR